MARQWVGLGAETFHLVDLDGAREGRPVNLPSVRAIVEAVGVPCELGGGIRERGDDLAICLDLGLTRLVIGTLAIREPDWFRQMCRKFPGRLVLGIDARERMRGHGRLAADQRGRGDRTGRAVRRRADRGDRFTPILPPTACWPAPNLAAMAEMQAAVDVPVVASGGVTTADDVARLAAVPMAGCIIGRALYEGTLTLGDALAAAKQVSG